MTAKVSVQLRFSLISIQLKAHDSASVSKIESRFRFYALNDVISQQKCHLVGIYPTLRNPCEARQRKEWQEVKHLHLRSGKHDRQPDF